MNNQLKIFSGSSNPEFAKAVCQELSIPLGDIYLHRFPSGEPYCQYRENIRGADVYLVQSVCNPADQMLMELLVMIDAAKRASAGRITAVTPYLGFLRQDRKTKSRTPISARLAADLITCAGANRVLGCDFHCEQAAGFFNIPVDNLYALPVFAEQINGLKNGVLFSPDVGGVKRITAYAKALQGFELAFMAKKRVSDSEVESQGIVGDVEGKNVIIVDDLLESGGTLIQAGEACKKAGAKSVSAMITHCLVNHTGKDRLAHIKDELNRIYFTDTVAHCFNFLREVDLRTLTMAPLFAKAISCINTDRSVTGLFEVKGF